VIEKFPASFIYEPPRILGKVLAPDEFSYLTELPRGLPSSSVVLHVSCQTLTVSHIPVLAQKILQALDIDFTTIGGPENCCGSFQWHMGENDYEKQIATLSMSNFRKVKPVTVISTCPDCDASFARHKSAQHTFNHTNILEIFGANIEKLKPLLKHRVERRVTLHYHPEGEARQRDGMNMKALLAAVPGLEILDAPRSVGLGGHCVVQLGTVQPDVTQAMFLEAKSLGATDIIVPYHGCYRQNCKHQLTYDVEVQHYLGILAQSMGLEYDEPFKTLRMLDDLDKAMDHLRPRIEELNFNEQEVRTYVKASVYV
jgi:Fe-S oxidoreductase